MAEFHVTSCVRVSAAKPFSETSISHPASGVFPRSCFEREQRFPRNQPNGFNILKACLAQLPDEFVLPGQSSAIRCGSTPEVKNFHPQASPLTACDQQQEP